jgi:hypothetical protein
MASGLIPVRDLSVRGIYRRHVVEPAVKLFGTNDPTIVGDPANFRVRANITGGNGWLRPVLEPMARTEVGPASWFQNVCEDVVGHVDFVRTWTHIDVRITLVPDADVSASVLSSLEATWKAGIEGTWNNPARTAGGPGEQWRCAQGLEVACRVSFRVHWVISNAHHVVGVHSGMGRSDEANWFVTDSGSVAAHEFGHMLGLPDEYVDDELCPGRSPVGTGTVMANNSTFIPQRLVQWVPDAIGSSLV